MPKVPKPDEINLITQKQQKFLLIISC